MIPVDTLLAFMLASLILIVIPGSSVLFAIGRSLALGRRAGVLSVVGNTLGTVPVVVAVAFGVGAIVTSSVVAFTIIKLAGAAYLVWLGVQAIRHRHAHVQTAPLAPASSLKLVREGFIVGFTNPKTIAFFLAVLPQFVSPAAGAPWAQMLLLGGVFLTIAIISDSAWAYAAGTARAWFARSPRRLSTLSGVGGGLLIGLGGTLAFTAPSS